MKNLASIFIIAILLTALPSTLFAWGKPGKHVRYIKCRCENTKYIPPAEREKPCCKRNKYNEGHVRYHWRSFSHR